MQRYACIISLLAIVLLGTGTAAHLHELEHLNGQRLAGQGAPDSHRPGQPIPTPPTTDCRACIVLHSPLPLTAMGPVIVVIHTPVATLVAARSDLPAQQTRRPIDCRGPPTL